MTHGHVPTCLRAFVRLGPQTLGCRMEPANPLQAIYTLLVDTNCVILVLLFHYRISFISFHSPVREPLHLPTLMKSHAVPNMTTAVAPVHVGKYFAEYVKSIPSMQGQLLAVTGATEGGLGFIAAHTFVQKGGSVLLLNRDSERAEKAVDMLKQDLVGDATVTHISCNLTSFRSVRAAAAAVSAAVPATGLDILCNNAGALRSNVYVALWRAESVGMLSAGGAVCRHLDFASPHVHSGQV